MAMCAPNPDQCGGVGGCEGSTAELAFDYLTKSAGFYQEYQYGYNSYYGQDYACMLPSDYTKPVATINGFQKLPDNNVTTLMNALATVGPIAINVDASTWHSYSTGIFDGCNQDTPDVNHVVVMVGYGTDVQTRQKYWLVRNSWSASWGEKGYIRLLRTDDEEANCGTDVTPADGVACAKDADKPLKVCGTCGAIYDSSYPLNARAL
jgi:cathepsin L